MYSGLFFVQDEERMMVGEMRKAVRAELSVGKEGNDAM